MVAEDQNQSGDQQLSLENLPAVAYVETDRYCDGCGYNLRTQAVCRDPRINILLCRCPECGRFHAATDVVTAARPWLNRLSTLLLFIWIVIVTHGAVGIVVLEFASTAISVDELITRQRIPVTTAPASTVRRRSARANLIYMAPYRYKYSMRKMTRELKAFIGFVIGGSFALGFVGATFLMVIFYHWRKRYYFIVVLTVPVLIGISAYYIWKIDAHEIMESILPYILANTIAQLLGGLVGVLWGRPFVRLLLCIFLPPRLRQYLTFLWLVDGKQFPSIESEKPD